MVLIEYKTKYKIPDSLKKEQIEHTEELKDCIRHIKNGVINMIDKEGRIEAIEVLNTHYHQKRGTRFYL